MKFFLGKIVFFLAFSVVVLEVIEARTIHGFSDSYLSGTEEDSFAPEQPQQHRRPIADRLLAKLLLVSFVFYF